MEAAPRPSSRLRTTLGWLSLVWGAYAVLSAPWRLAGMATQPLLLFTGDLAWLVTHGLPPGLWLLVGGGIDALASLGFLLAGLGLVLARLRLVRFGLVLLLLPSLDGLLA